MNSFINIVKLIAVVAIFFERITCCRFVKLTSRKLNLTFIFEQLPLGHDSVENAKTDTGRPIYFSGSNPDYPPLYLYHEITESGQGRWSIASEPFSPFPFSTINSWAVLPQFIDSVRDANAQHSTLRYLENLDNPMYSPFADDPTAKFDCFDYDNLEDEAIFFESSIEFAHSLTGFFVKRYVENSSLMVYSKIKYFADDISQYLYNITNLTTNETNWLIGEYYGEDQAQAFTIDSEAKNAAYILSTWRFVNSEHSTWMIDPIARLITMESYRNYFKLQNHYHLESIQNRTVKNVFEWLQYNHSLRKLPAQQPYFHLRNHIPMPMIGLGTGGIYLEDARTVFSNAMQIGYRLFDSAREYGNEYILGDLLEEQYQQLRLQGNSKQRRILKVENEELPIIVTRRDVFLETKVWPTHLGFIPTLQEILESLSSFRTHYIDLYLLHWPTCNSDIEWMHCHDTVDVYGNFSHSWHALEKAYAEGLLQSIGVSNFQIPLLNQLMEEGAVMFPHVIQNYAAFDELDLEVRQWCNQYHVAYQPYASLRNLAENNMPVKSLRLAKQIAQRYRTSEHMVTLKFFLQTGAAIIPRATQYDHLVENLQAALHPTWNITQQEMEVFGWNIQHTADWKLNKHIYRAPTVEYEL
jgi:diketogulonate reductase-like aldo/keto reductase